MVVRAPRRARERHARRIMSLFMMLCFGLLVLWGIGLYRYAESMPDALGNTGGRTDAIVVLTGGSGRLEAGLALLRDNNARRLFVSGVYQGIDVNQLLEMFRENPRELEDRVAIGNAVSTLGNAEETAAWVRAEGITSIRLVTAAYHMPRSLLEFGAALDNVTIITHPVFPEHVKADWWRWPGTAGLVITEYNKYLVAWARIMTTQPMTRLSGRP